jgi:uncharacterized membrane protein (UPF0182 family)
VLLLAFVLLAAVGSLSSFYTDLLWFREVDKTAVFWGQLRAKALLGLLAGIGTALIIGVNLWLVERLAPSYGLAVVGRPQVERAQQILGPYLRPLRLGIAAFIGLVVGLQATGSWQTFLLWRNSTAFGTTDPQFHRDVGFYVFQLPFLRAVFGWLFTTMLLAFLLSLATHYLLGGIRPQAPSNRVAAATQTHLSILLGLIVALKAWGYWLNKYELVYSTRGVVATGASYTDVKVQLPAFQMLFWVALICALLFFWGARTRGIAVPLFSIVLLAAVSVIVGGVIPTAIQRFRVVPQELQREQPYIQRNLDATRTAFGLSSVTSQPFSDSSDLTVKDVQANASTVDNIRLWDPEVLQPGVQSLQAVAQYYSFSDVDVDRYKVGDEERQVMIAVREVDPTGLASSAKTWQNLHLAYTHGYGVVVTQVNTVGSQGQPDFIVHDFDQANSPIPVQQPRVYFGEPPQGAAAYVVANSKQPEVDSPNASGGSNTSTYTGDGGIPLSSFGRRLAFALRFRDVNLLISGNLTSQSRLMFNRDIRDRVEKVAPFLQWDGDPYPVVVDGRILWVRDGYTTTANYPYSSRIDLGAAARRNPSEDGVHGTGNYIRNSVKAVVDAYTGKVTLYAFDESDPLLRAWRKAFPSLFVSQASMPDALRQHLRYPEDLFSIQTERYASYHIADAAGFYSKTDFWALPQDRSGVIVSQQNAIQTSVAGGLGLAQTARAMRPYYLLTTLPGQDGLQFVLVMPFTPNNKENMVAYMAVDCDPLGYGKLTLYSLNRTRQVFGPTQVNNSFLTNPAISSQISLLNQQGSKVILGNLLIVPVKDSLLYVQPIFVQGSGSTSFPLLQRVAVFYNNGDPSLPDIGFDTTLSGALSQVLGAQVATPTTPSTPSTAPPSNLNATVRQLLQQADREYQAAQAALKAGDLAGYQQHVNNMEKLLRQALGSTGATTTTTPKG